MGLVEKGLTQSSQGSTPAGGCRFEHSTCLSIEDAPRDRLDPIETDPTQPNPTQIKPNGSGPTRPDPTRQVVFHDLQLKASVPREVNKRLAKVYCKIWPTALFCFCVRVTSRGGGDFRALSIVLTLAQVTRIADIISPYFFTRGATTIHSFAAGRRWIGDHHTWCGPRHGVLRPEPGCSEGATLRGNFSFEMKTYRKRNNICVLSRI